MSYYDNTHMYWSGCLSVCLLSSASPSSPVPGSAGPTLGVLLASHRHEVQGMLKLTNVKNERNFTLGSVQSSEPSNPQLFTENDSHGGLGVTSYHQPHGQCDGKLTHTLSIIYSIMQERVYSTNTVLNHTT